MSYPNIDEAGSRVNEVRNYVSNMLKVPNPFSQNDIAEINAIMRLRSAKQMKTKLQPFFQKIIDYLEPSYEEECTSSTSIIEEEEEESQSDFIENEELKEYYEYLDKPTTQLSYI